MNKTNTNPWKGLQPYIDSEQDLSVHPFCGRDLAIRQLFELIDNNIVTTLYGKSGIGKTSLLQAGLFPRLRKEWYVPLSIRLGTDLRNDETFAQCIIRSIEDTIHHRNLSIISTETTFSADGRNMNYIWEYFASHTFKNRQGEFVFPVIILDQFEEIFNFENDDIKLLLIQLRELLSEKRLSNGDEFITNFRFVLSIREDDLFLLEDALDTYYISEFKSNRYRLRALNTEEAINVIRIPGNGYLKEEEISIISERITEHATLHNKTEINTQILSLCCYLLYNQVCKRSDFSEFISAEHVNAFGNKLLFSFYNEAVNNLSESQKAQLEEHLVTDSGRRSAWSIIKFKHEICKGDNDVFNHFVRGEYAILRNIKTHGEDCIELIHDRLADIILQNISHRKKLKRNQQKRISKLNVLTEQGRTLLDNSIDFGGYSNYFKSNGKYEFDSNLYVCDILNYSNHEKYAYENKDKISIQRIFNDPRLKEATTHFEFINKDGTPICTNDGIYNIALTFTNENVSKILFYGKSDSFNSKETIHPLFIRGGFCGILIDYDDKERVVRRTYIDENELPTTNIDGYSIVEFSYDEFNNPIKVRFYDMKHNICPHKNGNCGFNSIFDEVGNEIRRVFVDAEAKPVQIISGVYGRKMQYDEEGMLIVEANIDNEGHFCKDIDGYCMVQYKYDSKQRRCEESYLDCDGNLCLGDEHYAIARTEYDDKNNKWNIERYFDCKNLPTPNKDGQYMIYCEFDNRHRCISGKFMNLDKKAKSDADGFAEYRWTYNEIGQITSMRIFDETGVIKNAYWLDYNEHGTHVLRIGELSPDGNRKRCENGAWGQEIYEEGENDLPCLMISLGENNNPEPNNCGYIARRTWEDEQGRTTCEMYYDAMGIPMTDKDAVYGAKSIFDDINNTTKIINLDKDQKPVEDKNGICYILRFKNEDNKIIKELYYNLSDALCANEDNYHGYLIKYSQDYKKETRIFLNKDQKPSDVSWGFAYYELEYDDKSQVIKEYYRDKNYEIIPDSFGDYATEYLYSEDGLVQTIQSLDVNGKPHINSNNFAYKEQVTNERGNIVKVAFYDCEKNLCICTAGFACRENIYDEQGREVYSIIYDEMMQPLQQEDGSYGLAYEYGTKSNMITEICLNKEGVAANCNAGYAYYERIFDDKGRLIKERKLDENKKPYSDEVGDFGTVYEHQHSELGRVIIIISIDETGVPHVNNKGWTYIHRVYDENDRIIKEVYLDLNKQPLCDNLGDYGTAYEYSNDGKCKTSTSLDIEGNPHTNNKGWTYKTEEEDQDKIIKEYFRDINHEPFEDPEMGDCGKSYKYTENGEEIIASLDKEGNTHLNKHGYAYIVQIKDESLKEEKEYYLDVYREPTIDKSDDLGDYGKIYKLSENSDERYVISLGPDRTPHINKKGYVVQKEYLDEKGRISLRLYLNANNKPIKDEFGDYGTTFEYSENGNWVALVSLDKHEKPHINNFGYSKIVKLKDSIGEVHNLFFDMNGNYVNPKKKRKLSLQHLYFWNYRKQSK